MVQGTIIASAGSSSDHETYAIAEVDLDFLERWSVSSQSFIEDEADSVDQSQGYASMGAA